MTGVRFALEVTLLETGGPHFISTGKRSLMVTDVCWEESASS